MLAIRCRREAAAPWLEHQSARGGKAGDRKTVWLFARAPRRHFRAGVHLFNDEPVELPRPAALQQLKAAPHGAALQHRAHPWGSFSGACEVHPTIGVPERHLLAVRGCCANVKAGHRWLSEWLGTATLAARTATIRAATHTAACRRIHWSAPRPDPAYGLAAASARSRR